MNPIFLFLTLLGSALGLAGGGGGGGKAAAAATPKPPATPPATGGNTPPATPDPVDPVPVPPTAPPATGGGTTTPPATPPASPPATPPATGGNTTPPPAPPATGGNTTPTPPTPPVAPVDPTPTPPAQTGGTGDSGGDVADTPLSSGQTLNVMTGRVTTIVPGGDDIASVRIIDGPAHGHVSVNPDNTFALVMTQTDYTGTASFDFEVTYANGSTSVQQANLNVMPGLQQAGWGTGEAHYMLETDADDRVVVEHGDDHRKVYVSGSDDALTLSDIAALEGLDVSKITGSWLAANDEYGASEDMALAQDAGKLLWNTITPRAQFQRRTGCCLERGYVYDQHGSACTSGRGRRIRTSSAACRRLGRGRET